MKYDLSEKQVSMIIFNLKARKRTFEQAIEVDHKKTDCVQGWRENINQIDEAIYILYYEGS